MRRFVLLSFATLGFVFFVLSGGFDYAPSENSIQMQARLARETPKSDVSQSETRAQTLAQVEAAMDELGRTQVESERVNVSLTRFQTDGPSLIEDETLRRGTRLFTSVTESEDDTTVEEAAPDPEESEDAIAAAIAAAIGEVTFEPTQIRWISENVVDVRSGPGLTFDLVTRVTKGTEVAILENPGHGWINVQVIDSFQSGWVAEWLVTEPE